MNNNSYHDNNINDDYIYLVIKLYLLVYGLHYSDSTVYKEYPEYLPSAQSPNKRYHWDTEGLPTVVHSSKRKELCYFLPLLDR